MTTALTELLTEFIAFRSVAGDEAAKRECLNWIQGAFLGNARSTLRHGEVGGASYLFLAHPKPQLLWFAHIDVVPGTDEQFTLRIEGDRAFGRGVKDMKGAALPFLLAYREALKEGREPPISILLTSDEEIAGRSIPTLLEEGILSAPVAFTPDTGPTIVVEHKGVVWAELVARGRGTHGAHPWDGENPIPLLAEAIKRLAAAFPAGSKHEWKMTVSPTELQGSSARNVVPSEARCSLDIRYPPQICQDPSEALALVSRELPSGCTLSLILTADPLRTDPKHPMVQLLKTIAEEVLGEPVPIGREHGASDARFFGAHGIPAFLYGPIGGGIHSSEEWVSLSSLAQHLEINRRLLSSLSSER